MSLLGWQLCWCVGESVSSFSVSGMYCWSSLQGGKGCSPAPAEPSWLVHADALAYALFLKSTLEKKMSSAQVWNFIIHTSGTSAGVQPLIWCHIFSTCGLPAWGEMVFKPTLLSSQLSPSLFTRPVEGCRGSSAEHSSHSIMFQGMALELSHYSNSTENILLKP